MRLTIDIKEAEQNIGRSFAIIIAISLQFVRLRIKTPRLGISEKFRTLDLSIHLLPSPRRALC
jgi:hypothetical protein